MDIHVVHRYSHLRENLLCITYNALGVNITFAFKFCDGCTRSKVKAHVVRKKTYTRSSQPGERVFVDTTGTFLDSLIGNGYWIGVVDCCSHYYKRFFTKTRLQMLNKIEIFKNMTSCGTPVKYLRCDNVGEHQSKLNKACKKEKDALEYTTLTTPQLNGVIERRFAVMKEGDLVMLLNEK